MISNPFQLPQALSVSQGQGFNFCGSDQLEQNLPAWNTDHTPAPPGPGLEQRQSFKWGDTGQGQESLNGSGTLFS